MNFPFPSAAIDKAWGLLSSDANRHKEPFLSVGMPADNDIGGMSKLAAFIEYAFGRAQANEDGDPKGPMAAPELNALFSGLVRCDPWWATAWMQFQHAVTRGRRYWLAAIKQVVGTAVASDVPLPRQFSKVYAALKEPDPGSLPLSSAETARFEELARHLEDLAATLRACALIARLGLGRANRSENEFFFLSDSQFADEPSPIPDEGG